MSLSALDALARRLAEVEETMRREHERAAHRERVIDRLHAENQELRHGLLEEALTPVRAGLYRLYDNTRRQAARWRVEPPSGEHAASLLEALADELGEILGRAGAERLPVQPGDAYDPVIHRPVRTAPVAPEADGTVVEVLADGFAGVARGAGGSVRERVLRKAGVVVGRASENAGTASGGEATAANVRAASAKGPGQSTGVAPPGTPANAATTDVAAKAGTRASDTAGASGAARTDNRLPGADTTNAKSTDTNSTSSGSTDMRCTAGDADVATATGTATVGATVDGSATTDAVTADPTAAADPAAGPTTATGPADGGRTATGRPATTEPAGRRTTVTDPADGGRTAADRPAATEPAAGRTTIADPAAGPTTATGPADGGRTAAGRPATAVAPAAGRTTIADPAGGRMTATDPADGGRTAVGRMAAEAKAGAVAKGGLELASGSAGTGDARRHEEGDG